MDKTRGLEQLWRRAFGEGRRAGHLMRHWEQDVKGLWMAFDGEAVLDDPSEISPPAHKIVGHESADDLIAAELALHKVTGRVRREPKQASSGPDRIKPQWAADVLDKKTTIGSRTAQECRSSAKAGTKGMRDCIEMLRAEEEILASLPPEQRLVNTRARVLGEEALHVLQQQLRELQRQPGIVGLCWSYGWHQHLPRPQLANIVATLESIVGVLGEPRVQMHQRRLADDLCIRTHVRVCQRLHNMSLPKLAINRSLDFGTCKSVRHWGPNGHPNSGTCEARARTTTFVDDLHYQGRAHRCFDDTMATPHPDTASRGGGHMPPVEDDARRIRLRPKDNF